MTFFQLWIRIYFSDLNCQVFLYSTIVRTICFIFRKRKKPDLVFFSFLHLDLKRAVSILNVSPNLKRRHFWITKKSWMEKSKRFLLRSNVPMLLPDLPTLFLYGPNVHLSTLPPLIIQGNKVDKLGINMGTFGLLKDIFWKIDSPNTEYLCQKK